MTIYTLGKVDPYAVHLLFEERDRLRKLAKQSLEALTVVVNRDIYSGDHNADYRNCENTVIALRKELGED